MPFDPKDVRNVAVVLALGGIAGATVIQSHHDENGKAKQRRMTLTGLNGFVAWRGICLMTGSPQISSEKTNTRMT